MRIPHDFKTKRFWRHASTQAFAAGGACAAVLGLLNAVLPKETFYQGSWTLLVIAVFSSIAGLIRAWPAPIQAEYSTPKTCIKIVAGDLLDQDEHLVIGMCDTFDTEVPLAIAHSSLQGQVLRKLFNDDLPELNRLLSAALVNESFVAGPQKLGKTDRYKIGTVAAIKQGPRRLFMVAYSEMSETNEAHATADHVWKSLSSLWKSVSIHANGRAVSMGAIGGGQSRISSVIPTQDSIRLIALSFMFASRRAKICDELRIVVRPVEYEKLDRLELQSFLSSLRPS